MPPPDCYETPMSREGTKQYAGAGHTREYVVRFTSDFREAIELCEATAPIAVAGFDRKSVRWRSLGAPDLWLFTVEYGASAAGGGLRPDHFHWKVFAKTTHITQSVYPTFRRHKDDGPGYISGTNLTYDPARPLNAAPDAGIVPVDAHIGQSLVVTGGPGWVPGAYKILLAPSDWAIDRRPVVNPAVALAGGIWHLSGTGPDTQGAIGSDRDTVHGCDISIPGFEFSYTSNRVGLDEDYMRLAGSMIGKTNDRPFRGFPAGTMKYIGPEAAGPDGTLFNGQPFTFWNLAHTFEYAPHVFNFFIGSIFVPRKGGHEYLWCRYTPVAENKNLVPGPSSVHVEVVCGEANFDLLGITF